jgi:hypothetical protein
MKRFDPLSLLFAKLVKKILFKDCFTMVADSSSFTCKNNTLAKMLMYSVEVQRIFTVNNILFALTYFLPEGALLRSFCVVK